MKKIILLAFILGIFCFAVKAQQKVSPRLETGSVIPSLSHKGGNLRLYLSTGMADTKEKFTGTINETIEAKRIGLGLEYGIGLTDKDLMLLVFEYYYGKYKSAFELQIGDFGIGYKRYFLPVDLFVALRLHISFEDNSEVPTEPGYGLNFSFGKDVRVFHRFSMGVSLFYELDAFKINKDGSDASKAFDNSQFSMAGLSLSFILGPKGPQGKQN